MPHSTYVAAGAPVVDLGQVVGTSCGTARRCVPTEAAGTGNVGRQVREIGY